MSHTLNIVSKLYQTDPVEGTLPVKISVYLSSSKSFGRRHNAVDVKQFEPRISLLIVPPSMAMMLFRCKGQAHTALVVLAVKLLARLINKQM
jgi:hypothetical protein